MSSGALTRCAVCSHPEREAIERAYLSGETVGLGFQRRQLEVHAAHMTDPEALRLVLSLGGAAASVARLRQLEARALDIMEAAMAEKDGRVALRAIKEARETVKVIVALGVHLAETHGEESVRGDLDHAIEHALRERVGVHPNTGESEHTIKESENESHVQRALLPGPGV